MGYVKKRRTARKKIKIKTKDHKKNDKILKIN